MKKKNKGTVGYIIGIILYALLSITSIIVSIRFVDEANSSYSMEQPLYIMSAMIALVVFIILTLWFLSFTVSYNQGKSQIELLQELNLKE